MVSLDRLPNEVLCLVASFLKKKYDLAALSRTSRQCYQIASPILWKREAASERPGALHWAVENGERAVLDRALEAGVSPSRIAYAHKPKSRIEPIYKWWNYHDSYYDDPEWRLGSNDDESVDLDPGYVLHDRCDCYEEGCDEGIFNESLWEPIHVAASKGRMDMIGVLLDKGANIDALSWGICLCRPHLPVEAFRDNQTVDADELDALYGGGWTPLHVAICHGQIETAKYLLKRGASHVIYQGIEVELEEGPLQGDEEPQDPGRFLLTAMHHAAKHDHVELLQFLLEEGYQTTVNAEGPFMGTPLIQAIWYGKWDTVVPWLLKNGADLEIRLIETRLTPLMMACFSRRFDDAVRLIDLGADVSQMAIHQFSILHLVLGPGQIPFGEAEYLDHPFPHSDISEADLIRKLISKGFPVNCREALMGMTPLMVASASCNVAAMEALIEGKADVNIKDFDGLTAISRVGEAADGPAVSSLFNAGKTLLDAGAEMGATHGVTPLIALCSRSNDLYDGRDWEVQTSLLAKLFIERGLDPNEKGVAPRRPFTEALYNSNFDLARAILDSGGRPEENDVKDVLTQAVKDMYDDGRTEFLLSLDFAEYGMNRPSDAFLVQLIQMALKDQLWSRAADLMKTVPIPRDMRTGLIHRCLQTCSLAGDDPSQLVQVLLDLGEDPNGLWNNEPPIYYSLNSAYCWRSTPVLLNAGVDINMPTAAMPDGAFMFSINRNYQSQSMQMLAKHPGLLRDRPERLHQECWASVIRWEGGPDAGRMGGRSEPAWVPYVYWDVAKRLLRAGLRSDVKMDDGRDVKEIIEKAIPTHYGLGPVEREVLELFGIPFEEPALPTSDDDLRTPRESGDSDFSDADIEGEDSIDDDDEEDDDEDDGFGYFEGDEDDDSWDEDDDDDDDDDIVPGFIPGGMMNPVLLRLFM